MLDSLNKRIKFLNTIIDELALKNISTVHGRAEDFSKISSYREKFDVVAARAVASMGILSEYCMPYVKLGGYFIAMKGPSGYDELEGSKNAISILGGKVREVIETKICGEEINHNIIVVEKIKSTPLKYPRLYALIEKNPII